MLCMLCVCVCDDCVYQSALPQQAHLVVVVDVVVVVSVVAVVAVVVVVVVVGVLRHPCVVVVFATKRLCALRRNSNIRARLSQHKMVSSAA